MRQSQFQTAMMLGAAADRLMVHQFPGLSPQPDTFNHALVKGYGWDLIGKGAFGAVYDHPKQYDLVFKVGTNLEDGWLSYAAFCMRNWTPGSPLLEVHEIAIFERCYVAIFERLENWRGVPGFTQSLVDLERDYVEGRRWGHENGKNNDVLRKMHDELGTPYDLHQGNVMVRNGCQLVWTDPYCGMHGPESYKKYTRDNRVERYRTTLAPESASPVLRDKAEDRMLRVEPKHDNRAQPDGLPGALLPRPGSRRVRSAQCGADDGRATGAPAPAGTATVRNHVGGQREVAERLLRARRDMQAHVDMAREVRHKRNGGQEVRDRLQPAPKPNDPPYLRGLDPCGLDREAARNRRAEVYHERPLDFVQVDYAAIEQRIMLHHIQQMQYFQVPAPLVIDRNGGLVIDHPSREARKVSRDPRNFYEWARDIFAQPVPKRSDRRVA